MYRRAPTLRLRAWRSAAAFPTRLPRGQVGEIQLFTPGARIRAFFGRATCGGSCNGCQMMAALTEMIPGAAALAGVGGNRSRSSKAVRDVEVSTAPRHAARHGRQRCRRDRERRGCAIFENEADFAKANIALRFVDHYGKIADNIAHPKGFASRHPGLTCRWTFPWSGRPGAVFGRCRSWSPTCWGGFRRGGRCSTTRADGRLYFFGLGIGLFSLSSQTSL